MTSKVIVVTVGGGAPADDLEPGAYIVEVSAPDTSKSTVKTAKADAPALSWMFTGELKVQVVDEKAIAIVKLFKAGLRNTEVASGTFNFTALGQGSQSVEDTVAVSANDVEFAKIDIAFSWKEGSAPNQAARAQDAKDDEAEDADEAKAKEDDAKKKKKKQTPLPSCEFNDYCVRVRIHKARNLQSTKPDRLYDACVKIEVGSQTASTDFVKQSNNPSWDDELVFNFTKVQKDFWNTSITVSVFDHQTIGSNKRIGAAQLDCATVYRENNEHFMAHRWFALHKNLTEGNVMGFLKASIAVLNVREDAVPEDADDPNEGNEDAIVNNLVAGPGAMFEQVYLELDIIRAEGLPPMDSALFGGKADPYVKVAFGSKKVKTPWIEKTLEPEWNMGITLPITLPALTGSLLLSIFDHDRIGGDDIIARHRMNLHDIKDVDDALPRMTPRWINFYGHPRNIDCDFSSWYSRMAEAEIDGVEYRGRLLLGITGNRAENKARDVKVPTLMSVDVVVLVQILIVNMIPSGKYKMRLSLGENCTSTSTRRAERMHGDTKMCFIEFNEELMVRATYSVVPPPDDCKRPTDFVAKQIPDPIVSLVEMPLVKGPLYHPDEPHSTYRWKMPNLVVDNFKGIYSCVCLTLNCDISLSDGAEPSAPMAQLVCGAFLPKFEPPNPRLIPRSSVPMPGISTGDSRRFILETCVYHAEHIPAGDSNGVSDPFIRVSWANGVAETGVKLETVNPTYNEMLRLEADCKPKQRFPDIVVEIWDWDRIGWDTFLCRKVVSFDEAEKPQFAGKYRWMDGFVNNMGQPVATRVVMSFEVIAGTPSVLKQKPKKVAFKKKPGKTEEYEGFAIPDNKRLPLAPFEVSVSIISLRNMKKFRLRAIQAPSIAIQVMEQCFNAGKVEGANPNFSVSGAMKMMLPAEKDFLPQMQFLVYDNRFGPKVLVGAAYASLGETFFHPRLRAQERDEMDAMVTKRIDKMIMLRGGKPRSAEARLKWEKKDRRHKARAEKVQAAMQAAINRRSAEDAARTALVKRGEADPAEMLVQLQGQNNSTADADDLAVPLLATGDDGDGMSVGETSATDASDAEEDREPLWIERYDFVEGVRPEQAVSRLGQLKDTCYLSKKQTTAEDYFGPFDDYNTLELHRGWGSDARKAGDIKFLASITKVDATQALEAQNNDGKSLEMRSDPELLVGDSNEAGGGGNIPYLCRVYVIACRNLDAKDFGPFGNASDPYVELSLTAAGLSDDQSVRIRANDECKFQTLNPDYFFVRELTGGFPTHTMLRIDLWSQCKTGDDHIGTSWINLEDRWNGRRGYSRFGEKNGAMESMVPGSYTEKATLMNKDGVQAGSIEFWVDLFDITRPESIPKPIDIAPPPPIPVELRVTVWATRDVELVDVGVMEDTVDIYVRGFMDGMRHDIQKTDVHYRSTDGSGNFNWLMAYQFVLDARLGKVYPVPKESAFTFLKKDPKPIAPVLQLEVLDNDLFSDDFIGSAALNLLDLKQVLTTRDMNAFSKRVTRCCWWMNWWPWSRLCTKRVDLAKTLAERQRVALQEERAEWAARQKQISEKVDELMKPVLEAPSGTFSDRVKRKIRDSFQKQVEEESKVNVFEQFMPKKKKKTMAPPKHDEDAPEAKIVELPKYWVACRGPQGNNRVGDIQVSFSLVKLDAIRADPSLAGAKGRSTDVDRPEQPDFLKDPTRAAYILLWRQYKFYILTALCILISAVYVFFFFKHGMDAGATKVFGA